MNKYESLKQLGELLEKGLITREEFEEEKRKILWFTEKENSLLQKDDINNSLKQDKVEDEDRINKEDINVTKSLLLKRCWFKPRPWYENLILLIITLGLYMFFFYYKRLKFVFCLKNYYEEKSIQCDFKNFKWIFILSNLLTLGYFDIFWYFILVYQYMIFFKDRRNLFSKKFVLFLLKIWIILLVFFWLLWLWDIKILTRNEIVDAIDSVTFWSLEFIIYFYFLLFFLFYWIRVDYLIERYLTEDLKIIDIYGNVVRDLKKC